MYSEEMIKTLDSIGFNKNEILVYLDLIRVGKSSAMDISKRTKIHRPNVYDTVFKMIEKGIVTQSIENNRKTFYPISPNDLLNYFKLKEFDLEKVIPEIKDIHNKPFEERKVTMAEGKAYLRLIFLEMLKSSKPILTYRVLKEVTDIMGGGFLMDFHKRRIENKIPLKIIFNNGESRREKVLNKMKITEARELPEIYNSVITTNICGDKVILFFWEDPISIVIITNSSIASTYRKYFKLIWESAKVPREDG